MRAMPSPTDSTVPTSRDLRLGAEIRDLVADDAGDFSGADVHVQPFIACARVLSLVRIEPSIIWLPILTTRPPRMAGSTFASTATSRPMRARSLLLERVDLVVVERVGGGDFGGDLAAMARRRGG